MSHLTYLGVLAGCLLCTAPLEVFLRTRVYASTVRLVLTLLPTVVVFGAWDLYAIQAGHWTYDEQQMSGITLFGNLPLEEALFFVVVPVCVILTFEGVRRCLALRSTTPDRRPSADKRV